MKKFYSKKFYDHQMVGSVRSARVILPYVIELIKPENVVDVGAVSALGYLFSEN